MGDADPITPSPELLRRVEALSLELFALARRRGTDPPSSAAAGWLDAVGLARVALERLIDAAGLVAIPGGAEPSPATLTGGLDDEGEGRL